MARGPVPSAPRPRSRGASSSPGSPIPIPRWPGAVRARGFTEFFQAEQSLPLFGVRASLARAGVAATAAAEADRDVRLWQLRAEAGAAVARFVAEQERVAVATAQVRDIERLIEILRTREAEGEGSRFDRLRAEQELRDVRQQATAASAAVAEARAAIAGLLPAAIVVTTFAPAPPPVAASEASTIPSVDALIVRASSARAELRALTQATHSRPRPRPRRRGAHACPRQHSSAVSSAPTTTAHARTAASSA